MNGQNERPEWEKALPEYIRAQSDYERARRATNPNLLDVMEHLRLIEAMLERLLAKD